MENKLNPLQKEDMAGQIVPLSLSFDGKLPEDLEKRLDHFCLERKLKRTLVLAVAWKAFGDRYDGKPMSVSFSTLIDSSKIVFNLEADVNHFIDFSESPLASPCWEANWHVFLQACLESPERSVQDMPLLSPGEQELLRRLRGKQSDAPPACVHELFTEVARANPERIAVLAEGETCSYGELEVRANRLAHHLIKLGVCPELPVGVSVRRSVELVVAIFAILKAGGVYVPLDPAYPVERLAMMVEDTGLSVLVADAESAAGLPQVEATVDVNKSERWQDEPEHAPEVPMSPEQPAYLMYTSGSTGMPKGVVIPHRGVVRLVKDADYVTVTHDDIFLQFAPVAFDASIFELFCPLLNGAKVALYTDELLSMEKLIETIERCGVTILWLTAGLFHQVAAGPLDRLRSVKQWLAGGDVLSAPLVKKVLCELPDTVVINGYGPTENTTFTCCYRVSSQGQIGQTVPIGTPISGTQVYVLDEQMQPVPVGATGELYAGGAGLALGYWRREKLTAERFLTAEWLGEQVRLYKTGDLVRMGADGMLEFFGRIDRQVKIRGYRIEIGEIEAVLAEHPQVREQAVLVKSDGSGEKLLVAYLACGTGAKPGRGEMLDYLRAKLPGYMIPARFVFLDRMPLTPNGKIDHRQLPDQQAEKMAPEFVAPRNLTEASVAAIFAEVLGVPTVGADDDFFQLGGHSLSVMQVVSRLRDVLAVEATMSDLFVRPTVAELSAWIGERQGTESLPAIAPVGRGAESPLSSAQARLWFLDQALPKSGLYNNTVAVRLGGQLDQAALTASLQTLVGRHETLRTSFAERGGEAWQVTAAEIACSLPVRQVSEEELKGALQAEALRPFDLGTAPLLRAVLFELGEDDHVLLLVVHHIVSDAWSIALLNRELSALYAAGGDLERARLQPLPLQYADFAHWQQNWFRSGDYESRLHDWQEQLAGELPALQLPIAKQQASAALLPDGAEHRFALSRELTEQLKALSRQENATLNMTMLTAFEILLARCSGQQEFVIGTASACRTRQELEGLIGFFVNTLALRVDLRGGLSFGKALHRVRTQWLQVYANQEVPFEKLVERLRPNRELSRNPLFQVLFNFLSTPERTLSLQGLDAQPLEVEAKLSKFDLQLDAEEVNGQLLLRFEYNTALYEAAQINMMAGQFTTLLQSIVLAPDDSIWRLDCLLPDVRINSLGQIGREQKIKTAVADEQQAYEAPRDGTERAIAAIFAELLQLDRVGIHDHFFDLGGHSLLATRAVSRLRMALSSEIDIRTLFEHPTVAGLAAQVSLLRRNAAAEAEHEAGYLQAPLTRLEENRDLLLSFAQQRMWFLDQLEPGTSLYNVPVCWRLRGAVSVEALELTFADIVRRHEVLRTRFPAVEGEPMQVIDPPGTVPLAVQDLTALPEAEREAAAWQLLTEAALCPFDLSCEPQFRTRLFKLDAQEHLLLVTMHHIASDGWSLVVLAEEISGLYGAYASGNQPVLPELAIRYSDYAAWQSKWMQGEVLQSQLSYWKEQLSGDLPVLELPADRPRQAVRTYRGAAAAFVVPEPAALELQQLSKEAGVTLYMALLAAFNILLKRCTGLEDILVGSPVAGRRHEEVERLIGFFINTLVLRTDCSGDPTVRELLARVREVTMQAYANQDVPFEKLVGEIQPERQSSHSPLFQVMFVLQNTPPCRLELPDLETEMLPIALDTAKFDLTWSLEESPDGLCGLVEYNADLFDASTIERLIGYYQKLLGSLLPLADQPISALPLVEPEKREEMLSLWQTPPKAYPPADSFHELLEAQTERTPERLALVCGTERLTYRELNERANQLAHHLRQKGVGADTLVGLCAERSPELFIGLLGVLKAGGAYLPIDPAHPAERVRFLLEDAQVKVLLTTEPLLKLASGAPREVFCFDRDAHLLSGAPKVNPVSQTRCDHLAYVIYTSGSTGTPKGVMIEHRSLLNHARALHDAVFADLEKEGLRISFNAPLAFDSSVKQLGRLLFGDTLYLIEEETRRDPERMIAFLEEHQLDLFDCTPSQLSQLIACGLLEGTAKTGLVGGEPIRESLWQTLGAAAGWRFYNMYGPTECTVNASCCLITPQLTRPSLGTPLSNVQLYVLDECLEPTPYGVTGELHIGGAGVARGYWQRGEQTAERFVAHPFSADGERLYKTGDLVRRLADGTLEFVGRTDDQIKIRGYRIELGEIESALALAPGVRHAAVLARESAAGDMRLVAYAVPFAKQGLDAERIHQHLRSLLPVYMIPTHVMELEQMPVTANGKINRAKLPLPAEPAPDHSRYTAPRSSTEQQLARIYAEVLQIGQAGAFDHFFERGGHSLLATQAMVKIRQQFQIELPLRTLFEQPVLADLATAVDAAQLAQADHDRLSQMLEELQNLSPEELELLLAGEGKE